MTSFPSIDRLLQALAACNAPTSMIEAARRGAYHDFVSDSATPIMDLVRAAQAAGLHGSRTARETVSSMRRWTRG